MSCKAQFRNDQLPLYVIVRPTEKGGYEVVEAVR